MELIFKKLFWLLNAVLLILLGFLMARLVSSWMGYELLSLAGSTGQIEELAPANESDFRVGSLVEKVDRNRRRELMKKSEAPEPVVEPPQEVPQDKPEEEVVEEAPASSMKLDFFAAIVYSDPAKSLAYVKVDDGDGMWVNVGGILKDEIRVAEITRKMIRATDGTIKYLWEAKQDEKQEPVLAKRQTAFIPRKPSDVPVIEMATTSEADAQVKGITKVGPWEYHLERGLIDEQLQDLSKLGRQARVIPNYDRETGGYKGFKLIGVRPNSLYRAIGIRSGDVIMQVNGEEMNSPSKALELFTKLQTSNQISLDINRRGKKETLVYKIQ